MKTRAFKKVLSIVCVLAMLMSVCVVAMVGTASAAETYTLNVNGHVSQKQYEAGAILEDPDIEYIGVAFEGWYASIDDFTDSGKKITKAGDAKTLYAKLTSVYLDFENVTDNNFAYNPKDLDISAFTVVVDPSDPDNMVLKGTVGNGNNNFGVPSYAIGNKQFVIEEGVAYEISFKYKFVDPTGFTKFSSSIMIADDEGTCKAGGNKYNSFGSNVFEVGESGEWCTASMIYTPSVGVDAAANRDNLLFAWYIGAEEYSGTAYFDDICITPVVEDQQYSLYNKGVETKYIYNAGDTLPLVAGAYFMGWYDSTLTCRYTTAPAGVTKLYAKYSRVNEKFENGLTDIYDPNSKLADNGLSIVADGDNNILKVTGDAADKGIAFDFCGTDLPYTLIPGQKYTLSLDYKADNAGSFQLYVSNKANVGIAGGKTAIAETAKAYEAVAEWTPYSVEFVAPEVADQAVAYLQFNDAIYIDNIEIVPYVAPVATDDFVMDFEDDFQWSVDSANNYTSSTGNGYVKRGEILTEGENSYFLIKHYRSPKATYYFTVNNGQKQFNVIHCGIYTVTFKYKVVHSETPSKIGIALVDPSTGKSQEIVVVDEFTTSNETVEIREDSEWTEISYTFAADLAGKEKYTSIGLFVYNTSNVPDVDQDNGKIYGTYVAFDDVVIKTHTATNTYGLIRFDSAGGSKVEDLILTAEKPVGEGVLPVPERYGYDFMGWKYESNGVEYDLTADTEVSYMITEAYAVWKLQPGVIELTFRTNVDEFDAKVGTVVAYPGKPITGFPNYVPEAAGQKFAGWYYDREFTKPVDKNKAPSTSQTIYAKWKSTGTIVTFDNYPTNWFDSTTGQGRMSQVTDRISIYNDNGNNVMFYDFSKASNQANTTSYASCMLYDGTNSLRVEVGFEYTVTFKYKVLEAKGQGGFGCVLSGAGNSWDTRKEQTGAVNYGKASDQWMEATITFVATKGDTDRSDKNYLSLGISNDCKIYVDDVVVVSDAANTMNFYGTGIIFNTMGGKELNPTSGDPGTPIKLPTPVKAGYKFMGWYTDEACTTPFTDTVFGEERMILYAKWQLGKFVETFEEFPNTVKSLGVSGAYSFYTSTAAGFDASNIHGGETALFRNGATSGIKNLTAHRSAELALTKGDTYTISLWVKPTSIGDPEGTISLLEMGTFTGINTGVVSKTIAKASDLKEGEWNLISLTFVANSEFVGISTTANNDMYIDDITITLKGYTGSDTSASNGDTSVNPIIVLALVILSAGALIITGKKVYSK